MLLLIVLFPLIGAAINGLLFATPLKNILFKEKDEDWEKKAVGIIGCAAVFLSAVFSTILFFRLLGMDPADRLIVEEIFIWIPSGELNVEFSFLFDSLAAVMSLVVTWVGFLIHLYSVGYMNHDKSYARYFSFLNLFIFFMMILLLGDNFPMMFVGWEGVGLASYLLIGFWFEDKEKAYAGRKAFIANRIGDFGFILAIFLIFVTFGSVNYQEVFGKLSDPQLLGTISTTTITAIAILLFVGAVGKSAQFPLYVWLPDAMAGPTAVSALIHAATMVTAGVYLTARCNIIFTLAPGAQYVVLVVATFTAFFAAAIALTQNDIKKVLAYSTVSQLGFMFMAIGVGAYAVAIFHVVTHAFFKALLFLGSGSVIHSLSGEQDIRFMGGLRKFIPLTALTFFIGTLAIAGVPLLSGFYSKDSILAIVYDEGFTVFWLVGLITAGLTAFYMMRLYLLTFEGKTRMSESVKSHIHESPATMTVPLVILAFLSVLGGYLGFPEFMGNTIGIDDSNLIERFLQSSIYKHEFHFLPHRFLGHWTLAILSIAAAFSGIVIALYIYMINPSSLSWLNKSSNIHSFYKWSNAKFYVDEFYHTLFIGPFNHFSSSFGEFDRIGIDGIVNGISDLVRSFGNKVRSTQKGILRYYATAMAVGAVIIILIVFI
ncbi:MAG: NADH-quinone oxidoreductase subunit L [Thermodesulfobacteriota bacterium]